MFQTGSPSESVPGALPVTRPVTSEPSSHATGSARHNRISTAPAMQCGRMNRRKNHSPQPISKGRWTRRGGGGSVAGGASFIPPPPGSLHRQLPEQKRVLVHQVVDLFRQRLAAGVARLSRSEEHTSE